MCQLLKRKIQCMLGSTLGGPQQLEIDPSVGVGRCEVWQIESSDDGRQARGMPPEFPGGHFEPAPNFFSYGYFSLHNYLSQTNFCV